MAATFYERKDANNYTLGGVRLWVNEIIDSSVSPVKYRGFVDLGCVEEAPIAPALEFQEHFCAATGTRVKDRKIVKQSSMTITVTLTEIDVENIRLFFLGGDITDVAAAVGGGAAVNEVVRLQGTERRILKFGPNVTAVNVEPYGGGAPFTVAVDYVLETYYGHTAIRRVAGGGIADGDYVEIDYTYDVLQSKDLNPLGKILKQGQVLFMGVSDTGNEMIGQFDNCNINPTGNLNWNSNDFTQMQVEIEVVDDSVANPSAPFGTVHHLGSGQDI